MAEIATGKVLFKGTDTLNQARMIVDVLGYPTDEDNKVSIFVPLEFYFILGNEMRTTGRQERIEKRPRSGLFLLSLI